MNYRVKHITRVKYDGLVNLARFNLRLKPVEWPGQILTGYQLDISPVPRVITHEAGPFLVNLARLTLDKPTASLSVTSAFSVQVNQNVPQPTDPAPRVVDVRHQALADRGLTARAPSTYLFASPIAAMALEIADWAAPCLADDTSILAAASALMHAIHQQFVYDSKATKADTPPIQAFRARHGVCQDFAHIMIIALRHAGIPAAYVSGYLRTNPPPGKVRLVGADATHAWVNVWCGAQLGWIGFDPTNAVLASNDHILTAMGRDFADVSPVDGVFIGRVGQRMKVAVEVTPLGD
jgi:transglutaminase-like putative cysteine protease